MHNLEDSSRGGVPESEDSSAADITLNEFINLLCRKKRNDEVRARVAQSCYDLFDKNKDGKPTIDEVGEIIGKVYWIEYIIMNWSLA